MYYNEFDLTGQETADTVHNYVLRFWLDEDYQENVSYTQSGTAHTATIGDNEYGFRVNVVTVQKEYDNSYGVVISKSLESFVMNQGVVESGDGLYVSTQTNDGNPTYYYRGNVENNYVKLDGITKTACKYNGFPVLLFDSTGYFNYEPQSQTECITLTNLCDATSFVGYYLGEMSEQDCTSSGAQYITAAPTWGTADILWRVVRINEDGTIRLITDEGQFMSEFYYLNQPDGDYRHIYYSDTNVSGGVMNNLLNWYNANLTDYDSVIATSSFCEQLKVNYGS